MKRLIAVLVVVAQSVGFAPPGLAQSGGTDNTRREPQAQMHKASGTVTRVDQSNSKVTIAHGPVASLKWPAMTMNFVVRDKALFDKLPSGKKVEFEFVRQGRDYVITSAK